jgi:hypothetical protein
VGIQSIELITAMLENKVMKDVMELLRAKEQELLKVKRQVEALRIAAPLLGGDEDKARSSADAAVVKVAAQY